MLRIFLYLYTSIYALRFVIILFAIIVSCFYAQGPMGDQLNVEWAPWKNI